MIRFFMIVGDWGESRVRVGARPGTPSCSSAWRWERQSGVGPSRSSVFPRKRGGRLNDHFAQGFVGNAVGGNGIMGGG